MIRYKIIHNCAEYWVGETKPRLKIIWCWRAALQWWLGMGSHIDKLSVSPLPNEINCPRCIKLILKYYSRHTSEHFRNNWHRDWYKEMVILHNNFK